MTFLLGMRSDGMNTRHNNKTNDIPNSTKTLDLFIFVGALLSGREKGISSMEFRQLLQQRSKDTF